MGVVGGSEAAAPPFRPHQGKAEHTSLRLHSGQLQNKTKEVENHEEGCDDNGEQMIDCAS